MGVVGPLFEALAAGLSLWKSVEARKYIDELMALEKDWYEEFNKDDSLRSDAVLDNLQFKLRVLALGFASDVGKSNTPAQS